MTWFNLRSREHSADVCRQTKVRCDILAELTPFTNQVEIGDVSPNRACCKGCNVSSTHQTREKPQASTGGKTAWGEQGLHRRHA